MVAKREGSVPANFLRPGSVERGVKAHLGVQRGRAGAEATEEREAVWQEYKLKLAGAPFHCQQVPRNHSGRTR